jgi:hypothetical protein
MLRAVLDRSSGVGDGFLVLRGTWRRICESVDLAAVREGGERRSLQDVFVWGAVRGTCR